MPSSSRISVPTRPQNSSSVCQSRPLRARREASIETTAPTRPSQMAARSFSKPGRAMPEPERPRSSSITSTASHPSARARSTKAYWVDSSGRRNTAYMSCSEELVQSLGRCSPAQGLSRPAVEGDRHGREVLGAVHAEVGALREVLSQQPVGVLVRAALPGAVRIAEVDLKTSVDAQLRVL